LAGGIGRSVHDPSPAPDSTADLLGGWWLPANRCPEEFAELLHRWLVAESAFGQHPRMLQMPWEHYASLSIGTVLGPDSQWPHVLAVMSALAGRFGPDGVRLVVAFD
jgi:hypothetical protein